MSKHEDFLSIDQFHLDKELVQQPTLYDKYAQQLSNARKELDEAKNEAELLYAETYLDVKKNPGHFGLEKTTEELIKQAIIAHPSYQDLKLEIIDKAHEVDVLTRVVAALDQKKRALENLVQLFLSNYYSEPRVPDQDFAEQVQERSVRERGKKAKSVRIGDK